MISSLLAVSFSPKGYKVGILDGDISYPVSVRYLAFNCELYGDQKWRILT